MLLEVLFNGVSLGTLYCLITVGFAFTYNVARFFDISQGAAFLVGGYIGYQAVNIWHMGLFPGFLLALSGSGVFGAVVDMALISLLRKREATPLFRSRYNWFVNAYTECSCLFTLALTQRSTKAGRLPTYLSATYRFHKTRSG